jgi:lysophospholipase L1-like esterase
VSVLTGACGKSNSSSPIGPSGPPAAGSAIVYTAVGASDATGHGASVECIPFTECPNGTGYVPVTARQLRSQGFTVNLLNLGIPTAVLGRDFQLLGQQYNRTIAGNLIDQEMPFVQQNATVVTIFAGGNDVNTITAALGGGAGGSDQAAFVDAQVRAFASDYATLLNGIRGRAPSARLIVLNLPNLGALPYLAGASAQQRRAAQRAAVGMTTTVINPLMSQNVTVIDLMCDARAYQSGNYFSDGFHPNDAGYAFIAAEVVKAITSSTYPAPRASCAQMSAVP